MPPRAGPLALLAALALGLLAPGLGYPAGPPAGGRVDQYGDPLPPGAVARLGTVRLRPGDPFAIAALSPDRKTLATARNAEVLLWDFATGRPARSVRVRRGLRIRRMRFSPDGKCLATIAEGPDSASLHITPVAGGKSIALFERVNRDLLGLDFMAGGKYLF